MSSVRERNVHDEKSYSVAIIYKTRASTNFFENYF